MSEVLRNQTVVEVISGGVILGTITEFTPITTEEFGEEFESAKFSTTVIDLGIEEGRTKVLEVNSMYDVGGGNAVSSHLIRLSIKVIFLK